MLAGSFLPCRAYTALGGTPVDGPRHWQSSVKHEVMAMKSAITFATTLSGLKWVIKFR